MDTKLCKVEWNASANNLQKMYRTDLRIGEVVKRYILSLFEPFGINFWLRDSVNYL